MNFFELVSKVQGPQIKEVQSSRFSPTRLLANKFWIKDARVTLRKSSCFFRGDAGKHMHFEIEESRIIFGLRSRSCEVICVPKYVIFRIIRHVSIRKYIVTISSALSIFFKSYRRNTFLTSHDLEWPEENAIGWKLPMGQGWHSMTISRWRSGRRVLC